MIGQLLAAVSFRRERGRHARPASGSVGSTGNAHRPQLRCMLVALVMVFCGCKGQFASHFLVPMGEIETSDGRTVRKGQWASELESILGRARFAMWFWPSEEARTTLNVYDLLGDFAVVVSDSSPGVVSKLISIPEWARPGEVRSAHGIEVGMETERVLARLGPPRLKFWYWNLPEGRVLVAGFRMDSDVVEWFAMFPGSIGESDDEGASAARRSSAQELVRLAIERRPKE